MPIPVGGGERPFTEPTTGARSWRRGLVFMPPFWPFVDATRFYRGWWRHLVKIARGVTYLFVGRCHEAEPNPLPCVVPAISGPCCECSHYFVLPVCGSVNRYRALGDEGLSGRGCLRPSHIFGPEEHTFSFQDPKLVSRTTRSLLPAPDSPAVYRVSRISHCDSRRKHCRISGTPLGSKCCAPSVKTVQPSHAHSQ